MFAFWLHEICLRAVSNLPRSLCDGASMTTLQNKHKYLQRHTPDTASLRSSIFCNITYIWTSFF